MNTKINKVCIFLDNEWRGFFTSLGILFGKKYNSSVTYVIKDNSIHKIVEQDKSEIKNIIDYSKIDNNKYDDEEIIREALRIEKTYKLRINMLISENRGLGQGYIFNTQKVPIIGRSNFSRVDKYREIINEINKNELIINNFDLIIQTHPNKLRTMIADSKNIKYYSIAPVKYGDYHIWSDDNYKTNGVLIKEINNNLNNIKSIESNITYVPWIAGQIRLKKQNDINLSNVAINTLKQLIFGSKKLLKSLTRGNNNKGTYNLFGWLPTIYRQYKNYKFVKSISVNINDLAGKPYIYFPLHMEPEISLLWLSPEFNNTMEAISWLSKSVPADTTIILKEQPQSFSVRSKWYYKQLNKIANVYWGSSDTNSLDWIKNSKAVATITGTAGTEAIYFEKPVISFGKHQLINYLPSVYYISNYSDTYKAVNRIFSNEVINKKILKNSKYALFKTQIDNSFELVDYKNHKKNDLIDLDIAKIAINEISKSINSN